MSAQTTNHLVNGITYCTTGAGQKMHLNADIIKLFHCTEGDRQQLNCSLLKMDKPM